MFVSSSNLSRRLMCWSMLALVLVMAGCKKQEKATESAGTTAPKTFATPDDAAQAVVAAAKAYNRDQMLGIFGSAAKDIIYSGDAAEDKASFAGFVSDYGAMHRWRRMEDGSEMLITGADNKTFPIPLVKNSAGQWYFNAEAGKQEILSRRIGRNELAAIDVVATIATAQFEYYAQKHGGSAQFASKFISDEGLENGLYWPEVAGKPRSPLGPLVAFATTEGYKIKNTPQPFHGYYYRILDKQGPDAKGGAKEYIVNGKMTGGFAVLAYPARYQDSGVMTFMISQGNIMYQKDLGKATEGTVNAMTEFNPDNTWQPVVP
ncbi:MAG TPA: DUF2950 domain-containing protein [Candidatus Bathyarchaeia archaeon]|nr:DUF2950 domain-containing protein [Candidatus Bathyarchaeia archaeon]